MTDIVERLRQGIERGEEGDAELAMDRAADEIERLRMALKAIQEDPEAGLNIHAMTRTALAPPRRGAHGRFHHGHG